MWIKTGVTVRKWLKGVMTSVTLTFDLWPWPFAWTSLLSLVITPENFMMIRWWEHSQQGKSEEFASCDRPINLTRIGFKSSIFQPVWPWNLMDDLKNYRASLLDYIKLYACASSWTPRWIQTGVTVRKRSIRVKISDLLSLVTSKFDGRPWKKIGHLLYVASSFLHHFIAIGEFKLKLQSRNAQFGSKSVIYCPVWPWNLKDDLKKQ